LEVFDFFRKGPRFANEEFAGQAHMLTGDAANPTWKRELLDEKQLDFSPESLKHLDAYLEAVHGERPQTDDELNRVVMRCGAYVGEVIRKSSSVKLNWAAFKEAAKFSHYVSDVGFSAGTAGILWADAQTMCFPISKVIKFIENGAEDSAYGFARVIIEQLESKKNPPEEKE
jgi:hypothetical protein